MPLLALQGYAEGIALDGIPKRITAQGGTVYLGNDNTVSASNNIGSLTAGQSQDVLVPTYVFGPGVYLEVDDIPQHIQETATGTGGQEAQPAGTLIVANKLLPTDANEAFTIDAAGTHNWGPGGASALDTGPLSRASAGVINKPRSLEPVNSAVTAFNGGGQASAVALTGGVNRVSTSVAAAPPYDSVKLPAAQAGAIVAVVNTSANPIQVFGTGTDTINGQAAATGVTIPPNAADFFICPVAGSWFGEVGEGFSGQLFTELAQDNITAHAGGGQGAAFALTAQTSRITTVATAGDSVVLPASAPGLELMVINHGANAMQVYGLSADQIDDQAAATGVSQMPNSLVIYTCASAGKWYSEGLATGFGGPGLQTQSTNTTITAHAGGGQALATPLTAMINRLTTVATLGDSVLLPAFVLGLQLYVANAGAQSANVFPNTGDQINTLGANTAFALAAGKNATFTCTGPNQWHAVLSA